MKLDGDWNGREQVCHFFLVSGNLGVIKLRNQKKKKKRTDIWISTRADTYSLLCPHFITKVEKQGHLFTNPWELCSLPSQRLGFGAILCRISTYSKFVSLEDAYKGLGSITRRCLSSPMVVLAAGCSATFGPRSVVAASHVAIDGNNSLQ